MEICNFRLYDQNVFLILFNTHIVQIWNFYYYIKKTKTDVFETSHRSSVLGYLQQLSEKKYKIILLKKWLNSLILKNKSYSL